MKNRFYVDPKEFTSDPGSPIHDIYSSKVDKNGVITLEKVGEENTDDMIQAAKASTDLEMILSYYNQTGDDSVLNRYIPQYGDFTKIPKTLAEFLQLRIDSQNFFDALPADIKLKFDNNSDIFFAKAGNEEWYKNLDPVINPSKDEVMEEGVVDAS